MSKIPAKLFAAMAICGSIFMQASPAAATGFCNIKKTSDGFVALRAGPSANARLVGRMTVKDEVMIGMGQQGPWIEVTWWRGESRHTKGFHASSGRGWVHKNLVEEECG